VDAECAAARLFGRCVRPRARERSIDRVSPSFGIAPAFLRAARAPPEDDEPATE
jgi:hypothetical protein